MTLVTSKTSSLRSLILRAWKERWTDIQWGIHLKSVLPRGCSGDAYNLCNLMLQMALVGPVPNELILSYLRHSLAAQTISYAALLESIASFAPDASSGPSPDGEDDSEGQRSLRRPHCTTALLELVQSFHGNLTSRGKPEECLALATSTLKVTYWLLRCLLSSVSVEDKSRIAAEVELKNSSLAVQLVKRLLEDEFTQCLLFLGKAEDKDTFCKLMAVFKQLLDLSKLNPMLGPDRSELRQDMISIHSVLKNLDPVKSSLDVSGLPSFVHILQPVLSYEALLHPTSDMSNLSFQITALSIMYNISFPDLIYEVIRSLLLSISQNEGFESLKMDSFILIRLPSLLDKISKLIKGSDCSTASGPLKTPTDLYKVFDRLLKCEALLDSVDLHGKCNIIELLLRVLRRCATPLLTDTEKDDILKKREKQVNESKVSSWLVPEDVVGRSRFFELTLKAESTLDNIIKTLDVDCTKPDSMEALLGVLSKIIQGDSFELLLAPFAASGRLRSFVKRLIRCNQQSQESQGESVKNSLLRATLFDISFLLLVHITQSFGSQTVLSEGQGYFIESWIHDVMIEPNGRVKSLQMSSANDSQVDNLLQQLLNGELRTQVVKWQNVCMNVNQVVKEIVIARSLGYLKSDAYKKMMATLCSKLCAVPVCVVNFLASWKLSMSGDHSSLNFGTLVQEFMDLNMQVAEEKIVHSNCTDLSYVKERTILMANIVSRLLSQTGSFKTDGDTNCTDPRRVLFLDTNALCQPLKDSLLTIWHQIVSKGWLEQQALCKVHFLLKTGGPNWFTSCLVQDLLTVVYQNDLDKMSELLLALFHIDIEQITLALLLHVLPGYLQYRNKRNKLTDPHGTALAKLTVGCVYAVLMSVNAQSLSKAMSASAANGSKKRSADQMSDELPNAKMRRLVGLSSTSGSAPSTVTTFASSFDDYISGLCQQRQSSPALNSPSESSSKSDDLTIHPVSQAVSGFFRLLYNVVSCQETLVTPCTHFAFHFLEQGVLMGGRGQNNKCRLLFQHMNTSLALHLVKTVPHLFTVGMLSRLFDLNTSAGRKSQARTLCLLRNIQHSQRNSHLSLKQQLQ